MLHSYNEDEDDNSIQISDVTVWQTTIAHLAAMDGLDSIITHLRHKFEQGRQSASPGDTIHTRAKAGGLDNLDCFGRTPLSWAAGGGNVATLELMLDVGPKLESQDGRGRTSLHHAANSGHMSIVKRLVRARCYGEPRDFNGDTPLHLAAIYEHWDVLEYLL